MKERERTENGGKKSEETNGNHAISTENGHFIQMSASKVSVLRFLTCHSNGHFSFFLKKKKKKISDLSYVKSHQMNLNKF